MPLDVLAVAGLLAHEHQARVLRALAHHRLGRVLPQLAGPASRHRPAQRRRGGSPRDGGRRMLGARFGLAGDGRCPSAGLLPGR
jgi:hypothetical protein